MYHMNSMNPIFFRENWKLVIKRLDLRTFRSMMCVFVLRPTICAPFLDYEVVGFQPQREDCTDLGSVHVPNSLLSCPKTK